MGQDAPPGSASLDRNEMAEVGKVPGGDKNRLVVQHIYHGMPALRDKSGSISNMGRQSV